MNVKIKSAMAIAATAMLVSVSAHAHDCSGGSSGGMDATGNQCNDVASLVAVSTPVSASVVSTGATAPTSTHATQKVSMNETKRVQHKSLQGNHASGAKRHVQG
jgi:hypothetical protein